SITAARFTRPVAMRARSTMRAATTTAATITAADGSLRAQQEAPLRRGFFIVWAAARHYDDADAFQEFRMTSGNRPDERKLAESDSWTFFRQWLKNPLGIAALSPSGQQLTRQMIAELPHGTRRVVELGGGTGVFTRALIAHGIVPDDLLVL